jgi:hypothetical protein
MLHNPEKQFGGISEGHSGGKCRKQWIKDKGGRYVDCATGASQKSSPRSLPHGKDDAAPTSVVSSSDHIVKMPSVRSIKTAFERFNDTLPGVQLSIRPKLGTPERDNGQPDASGTGPAQDHVVCPLRPNFVRGFSYDSEDEYLSNHAVLESGSEDEAAQLPQRRRKRRCGKRRHDAKNEVRVVSSIRPDVMRGLSFEDDTTCSLSSNQSQLRDFV